jgi:hypothetical protein
VPGVWWIFVPRTPERRQKSREAVKDAKRGKARIGSKEASLPMPVPKAPPPRSPKNKDTKGGDSTKPAKGKLAEAIEEATEEAVSGVDVPTAESGGDGAGGGGGKRKRRRRGGKRKKGAGGGVVVSDEAADVVDGDTSSKGDSGNGRSSLPTVNEPLTFIQFIADHQPGATVEGEVESFASHGAFVLVGDARCYIPLSAMGDPPPRSAREVLGKGERRPFVVQALDAPRRGIELALPGFEHVAGRPTDETVEAEIEEAPPPIHHAGRAPAKKAASSRKKKAAAASDAAPTPAAKAIPVVPEAPQVVPLEVPAAAKRKAAPAKKVAATKAPAKKATATKATATKAAPKKAGTAAKAPAKKGTAAKAPAKKPPAKKVTAAKKTTAKSPASTKKAATAPKASAKKAAPAKTATGVKKSAAAKKTIAKKSAPAKKR